MRLKKCLQLLLLTAVFRLAGNQLVHAHSREVTVKETEAAILSCNTSALRKGQTSESSPMIRWVTNDGTVVCDFYNGESYAANGYIERAAISRPNDMEHEYLLTINKTRFSDSGDYFCKLRKPGSHAEDVTTVRLTIKGQMKIYELEEGKHLSIPLCSLNPSHIEFWGDAGISSGGRVFQVKNGQVTPPAGGEYLGRLTVSNGTLLLTSLTAKDQGKYVVRAERDGRAVLTIDLKIKTRSPSPPRPVWHWIVPAVICALVLVVVVCAYIWCRRRQMVRRQSEAVEAIDAGNGKIEQKITPMTEGCPQHSMSLLDLQGHG